MIIGIISYVIGMGDRDGIRNDVYLLMCSKWKGEEIMYTLGCIACFGFVVVIIAALLDL